MSVPVRASSGPGAQIPIATGGRAAGRSVLVSGSFHERDAEVDDGRGTIVHRGRARVAARDDTVRGDDRGARVRPAQVEREHRPAGSCGWEDDAHVARRRVRHGGRGQDSTPATSAGVERVRPASDAQPPMRKTLPPQTGHVPFVAGLPFFIVIFWGFWISTFFLSLTQ